MGLAYLFFAQSRMIYFPQPSSPEVVAAFVQGGGQRVDYETREGRQTAWLLPAVGNRVPERLWIVCAGNASQALSFADLQGSAGLEQDAFLLVDYPGYGVSTGKASPATIRESIRGAVPLAAKATGFPLEEIGTRGVVFGHSLGAAAALLGAEEFGVKRAVLLSPFTNTMDMARLILRAPLGWLVTHRFDNRARLASLKKRGGHVWIFHGAQDEVIPVTMGRSLANEMGAAATFREISGSRHNDLLEKGGEEILQTMREARR
ncbi:MAG TPA: alpha/beta fold hydrolase [Chthoniobacterales bacterium]